MHSLHGYGGDSVTFIHFVLLCVDTFIRKEALLMKGRYVYKILIILILTVFIYPQRAAAQDIDLHGVTEMKLLGLPSAEYDSLGVSAPALNTAFISPACTGNIIIGDSRIVNIDRMYGVNTTPDNVFVFAQNGAGFNYFENTALPAAKRFEKAHPEIKKWRYVICLGVNDLGNADKYACKLSVLSVDRDVYFMSVNPVTPNPDIIDFQVVNLKISEFNGIIKEMPGIRYIDTYSYLMTNGFETVDGVHFNAETSATIYNLIKAYLLI